MNSGNNSFWAKYGRHIATGAVAVAIAAVGTLVQWRHDQQHTAKPPVLTGIANEMRHDARPWAHTEKDASTMLTDIRDRKVAAVGVTLNAILVSTKDGGKYFVTDKYATFSQSLLLGQSKGDKAPDYQLVWLPEANIGSNTSAFAGALS